MRQPGREHRSRHAPADDRHLDRLVRLDRSHSPAPNGSVVRISRVALLTAAWTAAIAYRPNGPRRRHTGVRRAGTEQHVDLVRVVATAHRQRRVVSGEPVSRQKVAHQPGTEPGHPAAIEIVDDDAEAGDPSHFRQQTRRRGRVEVVQHERRMRDVERAVGEGKRPAIADVQLKTVGHGQSGPCDRGRRKDLGPAVERNDREPSAPLTGSIEQGDRDVGAARADVEQADVLAVRREGLDRVGAQADATEPAVDPAQVAQVPRERGRVVERSVEELDGVGLSLHRRRVPPCPRMGAVIVVAGEALIDLIVHPDGHLAAVPGGGPFNTSRTIARLGGEVAFLGRLSEDRFGQQLRGALMADGVDLSFTETTDAPTTLAVAELDDRGAATYRFHTADTSVPGLSSAAIERAVASAPTALHVGTLGLVLEPIASGLARAVAAADPGHPRDARSQLPTAGDRGP